MQTLHGRLMDDWIDVTTEIDIGEDERHLAGYFPEKPDLPKGFVWNAVPVGFRVRKVVHHHVEGDTVVTGAALVVERLA
jgi:hypothetical protein